MSSFDAWKKVGLSAAIIIALNVFFYAGLDTFYPAPQYDDYCQVESQRTVMEMAETQTACHEDSGNWVIPAEGTAYCDMSAVKGNTCWETFDEAMQPHQRNSFIAFTILGLASLLLGLGKLPMAVGRGLMYGGVVTMLLGTTFYWQYMEEYFRFLVSGVVLVILVIVGIKKLKD